jgi:hypothetical protein
MKPALLLILLGLLGQTGGCGMGQKYELWQLPDRSDGTPQYQILPAGRLAPELQKHMKKVPLTPEMEAEIGQDMARRIAYVEAEKKKAGK